MYNISTSSEKYHMNFYMYSQNDSDSKAVGLYKIEIALESEVAEDNFIWDNPQTVFLLEDKIDFCYERTLKYKFRMV